MVSTATAMDLQFKKLAPRDGLGDSATLSLLPPGSPPVEPLARPKHQLTIFYAGSVNVYDEIPEDKAHAIMLLAGNSAAGVNQLLGAFSPQGPAATFPVHSSEPAHKMRKLQQGVSASSRSGLFLSLGSFNRNSLKISCPPVPSQVLPQARKASLTRFLQRRKDRALQQSTSDFSAAKEKDCSAAQEENSAPKKENSVGSMEA